MKIFREVMQRTFSPLGNPLARLLLVVGRVFRVDVVDVVVLLCAVDAFRSLRRHLVPAADTRHVTTAHRTTTEQEINARV